MCHLYWRFLDFFPLLKIMCDLMLVISLPFLDCWCVVFGGWRVASPSPWRSRSFALDPLEDGVWSAKIRYGGLIPTKLGVGLYVLSRFFRSQEIGLKTLGTNQNVGNSASPQTAVLYFQFWQSGFSYAVEKCSCDLGKKIKSYRSISLLSTK